MAKDIPISTDTRMALQAAISACIGIRRWAYAHNLSPALISDILNDRHENVSLRTENRVRAILGLPAIPPRLPASCCPDCLARGIEVVHGDGLRCYGKEGVPVILAPNEHIVRNDGAAARRKRKYYMRLAVDEEALSKRIAAAWRALTPRQRADLIIKAIESIESEERNGD